eukprot:7381195-Prymnesium_polylepis.1
MALHITITAALVTRCITTWTATALDCALQCGFFVPAPHWTQPELATWTMMAHVYYLHAT